MRGREVACLMRVDAGYYMRIDAGYDMRIDARDYVGVDARNDEIKGGQVRNDHDHAERCHDQGSETY